jgi:hypothetical protein
MLHEDTFEVKSDWKEINKEKTNDSPIELD